MTTKAQTLFRISIKTDAERGIDPFQFCLERSIVAAGWPIDGMATQSIADCEERGKSQYPGRSFTRMIHAMRDMQPNDLVWTRRPLTSEYYLCRVLGPWRYEAGPGYDEADVHQTVPVEFVGPLPIDEVPGKVVNCFRSQSTVQRVHGDWVGKKWVNPSLEMSMRIYNRNGREKELYDTESLDANSVLQMLLPEDVEELVSLYLQVEEDYLLYSSSNKLYTAGVEYEMVKRDGSRHCYTQVKTGNVTLEPSEYANLAADGSEVYLYSTCQGDDERATAGVTVLTNGQLIDFMQANKKILPRRIKWWIDESED